VPRELRHRPFRGRDAAAAAGLLTKRQLNSEPWRRLLPNVYLHRDVQPDHLTWCTAAALLLPPGGAISRASAAYLYGADVLTLNPPVDVSIPPDRAMTTRPRLRVRSTRLDAGDIRSRGLLPVTTPTRTAFDLARRTDRTEAVVGLDALLKRGLINLGVVRAYVAARADWPGARPAAIAPRAGQAAGRVTDGDPPAADPPRRRLSLPGDPAPGRPVSARPGVPGAEARNRVRR
jgi:hypothetical protein